MGATALSPPGHSARKGSVGGVMVVRAVVAVVDMKVSIGTMYA